MSSTTTELSRLCAEVASEFRENRRVLSFDEYLELFAAEPARFSRDAAAYVRDAFDHYGKVTVERPWGKLTRYRLFDLPWLSEAESRQWALVGQEEVQSEIYRVLSNFVREGRPNRLPLLHGPNGSSKSTLAACLMRGLEHYSSLDEGALYRFHWVFPSRSTLKGSIGFGDGQSRPVAESYAHLPEGEIDSRLFVEVRDHPLFLIPQAQRSDFLARVLERAGTPNALSPFLLRGGLSHKNREVFEALLLSYGGDMAEVLRHVQVERYFISRRYRCGAVTVGPQLSVDAGERQITADRSLGALPTALQAVTLFEAFGELVDASGGMLEFSDLLKRPLDAFKYLQQSVETGAVDLRSQSVPLNCFMLASGNELQLTAFRQHPEFQSFRGRLELIRAPYLRASSDEQAIYDAQIAPQIQKHVAPHATRVAAWFAVLTRMRRPNPKRYGPALQPLVGDLTALEKMDLYEEGKPPSRLDDDSTKRLTAAVAQLYHESDAYLIYEGSTGASPRAMRSVLLDAAQSDQYDYLSPFAVIAALHELCTRVSEYSWLQEEKRSGGYHDVEGFLVAVRARLLDTLEVEFRVASGLVDAQSYSQLLSRYVHNVSYWVKGEKARDKLTGEFHPPDDRLMEEVEALLKSPDETAVRRNALINNIAAWAIEQPDRPVESSSVFEALLKQLREAVFQDRRSVLLRLAQDLVVLVREEGVGLDTARQRAARATLDALCKDHGYIPDSAADSAEALARERLTDPAS